MIDRVSPKPGRPKSEEKRAAIQHAASELFLTGGLKGTSMDAVAERAGVSKQTVYSHFDSKEELFRACIKSKIASYGFAESAPPEGADLARALRHVAHRFLELLFDEEVVAIYRTVIGESVSYQKIAELFYETGPRATINAVARFLAGQMERGRLHEDDPQYAAILFLNMVRGQYHMMLLMNLRPDLSSALIEAHVQKAVEQFLVLYQC